MAKLQIKAVDSVLKKCLYILDKYILQFEKNTCYNLDQFILQFVLFSRLFMSRFGANCKIADKSCRLSVPTLWLEQRIAESFHIQGAKNQILSRIET